MLNPNPTLGQFAQLLGEVVDAAGYGVENQRVVDRTIKVDRRHVRPACLAYHMVASPYRRDRTSSSESGQNGSDDRDARSTANSPPSRSKNDAPAGVLRPCLTVR